jgi:hypothetical protein
MEMTTARTLGVLLALAPTLVGPSAFAKHKKKAASSDAAATSDQSKPSGEAAWDAEGTAAPAKPADAPAAAPEKTEPATATVVAEPSAKPAAQSVDSEDEAAPVRAAAVPAARREESAGQAEVVVVPAIPVVRRATGNADSPEGVTWKASGWDVSLYGYAGLNVMQDSTQSFGTSSTNTILQRRGTVRGNSLQAQATARDSRLGFRLAAPPVGRVYASVNIETDFNAPPPVEYTEANSVTQAGLRMRHYYMKVETPVVDILAGQYHDLFGWGGKGFYPSTLAFLGITGEVYHRKPQLRLSKTLTSDAMEFEIAGAALAPVQKNGGYPDVEAGMRLSFNHWTGARQQAYGQPAIGRASLGVSAIGRHFEVSNFIENSTTTVPATGYGIAGNAFLPVIPATNAKERGNALSLTGEYSRGTGIADMYSDLTGGLLFPSLPNPQDRQQPTNPPPIYVPNIDSGIVTFDGDFRLRTCNWEGFVVGAQYYLPIMNGRVWASGTYSEIRSSNIKDITPLPGWAGIFTHSYYYDASLFVAITDQIQAGAGFQRVRQDFGDDVVAWNYRTEFAMHMFF